MKTLNHYSCALWLMLAAAPVSVKTVRADPNPALLYYQAFLLAPQMSEAELDYLGTNAWAGNPLPARYGELVARYDEQFNLVRLAAHATAPCDWGLDFGAWPRTPMPHLARGKAVAVGSEARVTWELAQGKIDQARDDVLATLTLARNISRDRTLIGALVQYAMESITSWNVAVNFGGFTPEALKQLSDGIDAAPPAGTLASAVTNEAVLGRHWLVGTIEDLRQTYPNDDAKVMAGFRDLFKRLRHDNTAEPDPWEKFIQAAGGSSDSILNLVRDAEPMYQKLELALTLPYPEYLAQKQALHAEFEASSNPLVASFPKILDARRREARAAVTIAMVKAAVAYKLQGLAGLQSVTDPAGTGPFGFRRFIFNGVDRGFQLTSVLDAGGFAETLVFVETPGPGFLVGGPHVGTPRGK